jgi:hypothetical protein
VGLKARGDIDMPAPPAAKSKPVTIDPALAKAALDRFLPRLEKIRSEELGAPRTGVDMAALFALGVAEELARPEMRVHFAKLPKEAFDVADLDDLGPAALATWYASTELLAANAHGTEARLHADLVSEASDLRGRMLRVADYHFDPDTLQGREVADIRIGTGHRDLAQDLARLTKLYRLSEARLSDDRIWYRKEDGDRASELAQQILRELGESRTAEQKLWTDRVQRAWVLLSSLYEEVTATATWLRRRDPDTVPYPSLSSAGRNAPRRG